MLYAELMDVSRAFEVTVFARDAEFGALVAFTDVGHVKRHFGIHSFHHASECRFAVDGIRASRHDAQGDVDAMNGLQGEIGLFKSERQLQTGCRRRRWRWRWRTLWRSCNQA